LKKRVKNSNSTSRVVWIDTIRPSMARISRLPATEDQPEADAVTGRLGQRHHR